MRKTCLFFALIWLLGCYEVHSSEKKWVRSQYPVPDNTLTCISFDLATPPAIYIGSKRRLYRNMDINKGWEIAFECKGEEKGVNDIFIDKKGRLYISTKDGLYQSSDRGETWTRLFDGIFPEEDNILSFWADPGLKHAYVLTPSALYESVDGGVLWRKPFTNSSYEAGEWDEDEYEEDENVIIFTAMTLDTEGNVYLATNKGLLRFYGQYGSWEMIKGRGAYDFNINDCIISGKDHAVYIATDKGVFRYDKLSDTWQNIYQGLGTVKTKGLSFGVMGDADIWCITSNEIYMTENSSDGLNRLFNSFSDEPTIRQTQEMAIEYAEVSPKKIKKWRRGASLKAILPKVTVGIDKSGSDTYEIYTNSSNAYSVMGPRDYTDGWDVTLTWDLGDLIFNDFQTSIDVRSKLMVQLREDILSEVTRLYFERRRLQIELLTRMPDLTNALPEKELRVQELTASLDALTGGGFSGAMDTIGEDG